LASAGVRACGLPIFAAALDDDHGLRALRHFFELAPLLFPKAKQRHLADTTSWSGGRTSKTCCQTTWRHGAWRAIKHGDEFWPIAQQHGVIRASLKLRNLGGLHRLRIPPRQGVLIGNERVSVAVISLLVAE
jgi:hypothetical protein